MLQAQFSVMVGTSLAEILRGCCKSSPPDALEAIQGKPWEWFISLSPLERERLCSFEDPRFTHIASSTYGTRDLKSEADTLLLFATDKDKRASLAEAQAAISGLAFTSKHLGHKFVAWETLKRFGIDPDNPVVRLPPSEPSLLTLSRVETGKGAGSRVVYTLKKEVLSDLKALRVVLR
jgi:hypothetical protein